MANIQIRKISKSQSQEPISQPPLLGLEREGFKCNSQHQIFQLTQIYMLGRRKSKLYIFLTSSQKIGYRYDHIKQEVARIENKINNKKKSQNTFN